jgi:hypothetical protein
MALVRNVEEVSRERTAVHQPVDCSCTIFEIDGQRYLQLDTFGSPTRKLKDKVSQALQFDRDGARRLRELLDKAFPELASDPTR